MEEALLGWNGHELAAAVDGLLHGECRNQGLHAGEQIFRPEPLSQHDRIARPSRRAGSEVLIQTGAAQGFQEVLARAFLLERKLALCTGEGTVRLYPAQLLHP